MLQHFSAEDVSSLLGIRPGRLRYWDRIGLVKPSVRHKGKCRYDFRDLICLRTAQGLIAGGLPATRVRRSVQALKKKFPGLDDSLSNKRIYIFGNQAVISHKNRLLETESGQLLLNFDVDELSRAVARKTRTFPSRDNAEAWFEEGLKYDLNKSTFAMALRAYSRAVELDPGLADAHVNIGNIHYKQGQLEKAEQAYRRALAENSSHAKAYFNLGNVVDDLGRVEEAIGYYEDSLQVDAGFADAYYNLAVACEKLDRWEEALNYWKLYVGLDREGPHAHFARKRIRLLRSNLVTK